jgi:hypothetical protein
MIQALLTDLEGVIRFWDGQDDGSMSGGTEWGLFAFEETAVNDSTTN